MCNLCLPNKVVMSCSETTNKKYYVHFEITSEICFRTDSVNF